MSEMTEKLDVFERAFSTGTSGCRRRCACGKEYWDSWNVWDWDEGETEALAKDSNATAVEHSVGTVAFEGTEYAMDCPCWRERATKIIRFIDGHAQCIADYLNLEKERKQRAADQAPTVKAKS